MLASRSLRLSLKQARAGASATRSLSASGPKPISKPPTPPSTSGTAMLNQAKSGGVQPTADQGSSGVSGLVLIAGLVASVGAVSLQMERSPPFRKTVQGAIPEMLHPLFSSAGSVLRSAGVVDMIDAPLPAKEQPVAAKRPAAPELPPPPPPVAVEPTLPMKAEVIEENDSLEVVVQSEHRVAEPSCEPAAEEVQQIDPADEGVAAETLDTPPAFEKPPPASTEDVPARIEAQTQEVLPAPVIDVDSQLVEMPSASSAVESQYREEASEFRREMELHYLSGIEELSVEELRNRMNALISDYAQRSKWEAVRLHQSVRHVEKEIAEHYASAMAKQRAEIELQVERELTRRETDVRVEMSHIINDLREAQEFRIQDALKSQERSLLAAFDKEKDTIEEKIRKDAELDHQADLARANMEQMNKYLDLHRSLEEAHGHVAYFDKMADQIIEGKRYSARVHETSAALLALEVAMSTSKPIRNEIAVVKKICDQDSVISAVVDSIPEKVRNNGAPTITELRARFAVAKEEARKAALAPNNAPKMVGQMIGSTLAALLWEVEGNVPGESEEAVLARASYFLEHGNLKPAFDQLSQLRGYPKSLMKDWELGAQQRLIADQALACMKAAAAIEHLERQN